MNVAGKAAKPSAAKAGPEQSADGCHHKAAEDEEFSEVLHLN